MKKRLLSMLLCLIMVAGMLPNLTPHLHAAYEDGQSCENCGHYHWDSHCCGNCGNCSSDCDDDCYEETHCISCGACRADGNFACECGYCYDCAKREEPEKHCDYCGEEDDGGICPECHYCSECVTEFEEIHCSVCEECIGGGLRMCTEDHEHPSGLESAHCTGESVVCGKCGGCFFEHEGDYCWDCELCQKCALDDNKHCFECGECSSDETPCEEGSKEAGDNTVCESCCMSYDHHCSECFKHVNFDDYEGVEGWCRDGGHGTHCDDCAELTRCLQCDRCWECAGLDLCDDCYLCEECCRENTETMRCDHDYCVESSDYEDHLCPDCGECPGDDPCEFCGRCASCADSFHCEHDRCEEDPDYDYEHVCPGCSDCFYSDDLCEACELCADCNEHCPRHDLCPENASEWDAHACPDCGECPGKNELCEICGLCSGCAAHCKHGQCKYADDFGDNCSCVPCPHDEKSTYQSNRQGHWKVCSECGLLVDRAAHTEGTPVLSPAESTANVDVYQLPCEDCGYVLAKINSPKGEVPPHVHRYDANGYCQVCGAKSDGKPYIIHQPADFECSVQGDSGATIKARYSLRAYGSGELSYQWYYSNGNKIVDDGSHISGAQTPNLTMTVPEDACLGGYGPYYCVVTNAKGSVRSADAHLIAKHNYRGCYPVNRLDAAGNPVVIELHYANGSVGYGIPVSDVHITCCVGCSAEKPSAKPEDHVYSSWVIEQEPSDKYSGIKARTCKVCRHTDYGTFTAHECVYTVKYDDSGHWEECKICSAKKPLRDSGLEWGAPAYKESHRFANFERTVEPTEYAFGEETAQCEKAGCNATLTRQVKKLPHEHEFFTLDEHLHYATENLGTWDVNMDALGSLIDASMTVEIDGVTLTVFGADRTHHWFYCKKPGCNVKGPSMVHMITGLNVDLPPDGETDGSGVSTCKVCEFEIRKAMPAGSYPIVVENGISLNAQGNAVASGRAGDVITIRPRQLSGKTFSRWNPIYGVTLSDPTQEETTFTVKTITPAAANPTYADYIIHLEALYDTCPHSGGRVTGEAIPAGCTSYGKEGDTLCAVCGEVLTPGGKTDPTGHALEDKWVIDPKSVEPGDCRHYGNSGNLICPNCGETMQAGEKTPHMHASTTLTDAMPATCTTRGFTGNRVCDDCGKLAERGAFIDKCEHTYGPWRTLKPAAEGVPGRQMRECSACSVKDYREYAYTLAATGVTLDFNALALQPGGSRRLTATVTPDNAPDKTVSWTSSNPAVAGVENGLVTALTEGSAVITVTTADGGFKAVCNVTVSASASKTLMDISVTTAPAKTAYRIGESFSTNGMVVTARYSDGTSAPVTAYTYSPNGALKESVTQIVIRYTEDGVTRKTEQSITVTPAPAPSGGEEAATRFTLSFVTNGGSAIGSVTADSGSVVSLAPYTPSRENYDFAGWYSDSGLTAPVSSVTLDKDMTVYAKWTMRPASTFPFEDVKPTDWFCADAEYVWEKGLMKGTGSKTFSPAQPTSRGMIVVILYRMENEPAVSGKCPFDDVQAGSYYEDAITWAAANEIVNGYGESLFGADDSITREQMAAILSRYAQYKGLTAVTLEENLTGFCDDDKVSTYAISAMNWAVGQELIRGTPDNTLDPQGQATRAQVTAILHRFCEKIAK